MLSLIKIRVKYIIRNPCLLFWTYLFLPIIITIAAVIIISRKEPYKLKSFKSLILNETKVLFNEEEKYPNISEKLNYTGFLVDDQKDCEKILSLLNEFNLCNPNCPLCADKENSFNNYTLNIIQIEKKKNKYNVEVISRDTFVDIKTKYLFEGKELNQDLVTDPYYVKQNLNGQVINKFNTFFELESLISRILIRLEGKSEKNNHNFEMQLGYNKYPDS